MSKNQYINTLPQEVQDEIRAFLHDLDTDELTNSDINNAMNSRISDLGEWFTLEELERGLQ